jgi:hypothetical protein
MEITCNIKSKEILALFALENDEHSVAACDYGYHTRDQHKITTVLLLIFNKTRTLRYAALLKRSLPLNWPMNIFHGTIFANTHSWHVA